MSNMPCSSTPERQSKTCLSALLCVDFRIVNYVIPLLFLLSRLNHFSFRLRPVVLSDFVLNL